MAIEAEYLAEKGVHENSVTCIKQTIEISRAEHEKSIADLKSQILSHENAIRDLKVQMTRKKAEAYRQWEEQ